MPFTHSRATGISGALRQRAWGSLRADPRYSPAMAVIADQKLTSSKQSGTWQGLPRPQNVWKSVERAGRNRQPQSAGVLCTQWRLHSGSGWCLPGQSVHGACSSQLPPQWHCTAICTSPLAEHRFLPHQEAVAQGADSVPPNAVAQTLPCSHLDTVRLSLLAL